MRIGMVGLGRMGANMVRRLLKAGHECVAHDPKADALQAVVAEGARGAGSLAELVGDLTPPRAVWIMVPAAIVDSVIAQLRPLLTSGDILIDGGNSHYHHDIRRAGELAASGLRYLDVGTSGGVLGCEQGYCLMIGGESAAVAYLEPIFAALAPGGRAPANPAHATAHERAALGYLHCGAAGAGHFVKMVHNGIEYGMMAAYAEGLNILAHADAGMHHTAAADAETAPLADPRLYQYQLDLPAIAEVWRHGSIISSRLLDLTADSLSRDAALHGFSGRVSDSGEGRWTVQAAIDVGVPAEVLTAALYARFASQGGAETANKLLSAMRLGFGGHLEKPSGAD
jgi:6-phosphogluconate dehydrogenase